MGARVIVERVAADRLASVAADWLADAMAEAISVRGRVDVAFSGGRTPWAALAELATSDRIEWDRVHVWQVDERIAPDGDPSRNAVGLAASLLDRAPIPADQVHFMAVTSGDLDGAAAAYAAELATLRGGLDVVHLGLGADGHTASWPPGDPVIDATAPVALSAPYQGQRRMTITPPVVAAARSRLFLVSGDDKAAALAGLIARDPRLPATRVPGEGTTILCDLADPGLSDRA